MVACCCCPVEDLKLRVSKGQHTDKQRCPGGTTLAYLLKSNDLKLVSTECYIINFLTYKQIYCASLPSQGPTEMNRRTWLLLKKKPSHLTYARCTLPP